MSETTFFTDHWQQIEPERIARYERMFVWRDEHVNMLKPLDIQSGSRVLDYGCGPGFVSRGMTDLIGSDGHVFGVDLNKQFVADATRRAEGVKCLSYHVLENRKIPLSARAVDRLLCKNVLEYVPDVQHTLAEFHRVVEPGGRLLIIDSDWRFVLVEPWGHAQTAKFFEAASVAFKTPEIGRQLRKLLSEAGFDEIEVRINAGVDISGGSLAVLTNMASYAGEFGSMAASEIESLMTSAETAVETGDYLFCLPQFYVTAIRP